jgi:hypothetical protein
MKKNMAGVVAVSIAAFLFAGCGSSGAPKASTMPAESTTTTVDLLSNCVASYEASSKELDQALGVATEASRRSADPQDSSELKAVMPPLVAAQKTFANAILRMNCPDNVKGDIDSLVNATWELIAIHEVMAKGTPYPREPYVSAASAFNSARSILGARLGLPSLGSS